MSHIYHWDQIFIISKSIIEIKIFLTRGKKTDSNIYLHLSPSKIENFTLFSSTSLKNNNPGGDSWEILFDSVQVIELQKQKYRSAAAERKGTDSGWY